VCSLLPCIGFPLGIAALILGIRGLNYAGVHPESKGRVHAWIGVVLGSLCTVVYSLLLAFLLLGAAVSK